MWHRLLWVIPLRGSATLRFLVSSRFLSILSCSASLVAQYPDTFLKDLLRQPTIDVHRVLRAGYTIPPHNGSKFLGIAAQQDGAALRRHNVEDHTRQLPLQRLHVSNRAYCRADFQQRL